MNLVKGMQLVRANIPQETAAFQLDDASRSLSLLKLRLKFNSNSNVVRLRINNMCWKIVWRFTEVTGRNFGADNIALLSYVTIDTNLICDVFFYPWEFLRHDFWTEENVPTILWWGVKL